MGKLQTGVCIRNRGPSSTTRNSSWHRNMTARASTDGFVGFHVYFGSEQQPRRNGNKTHDSSTPAFFSVGEGVSLGLVGIHHFWRGAHPPSHMKGSTYIQGQHQPVQFTRDMESTSVLRIKRGFPLYHSGTNPWDLTTPNKSNSQNESRRTVPISKGAAPWFSLISLATALRALPPTPAPKELDAVQALSPVNQSIAPKTRLGF